jgi:hypothetical protein
MTAGKLSENQQPSQTSITVVVAACVMAVVALYMAVPVALNLPELSVRDIWPEIMFALILFVLGAVVARYALQSERSEGSERAK